MKPRTELRRISEKRERELRAANNGSLPRSTVSAARKPIAKKRRTKAEDLRVYGSREFRAFLRSHACLGCGYRGEAIQQAHRTTGGMGRKSGWQETAPLCGPRVVSLGHTGVRGGVARYLGCHTLYDDAKRSWRTNTGQTLAQAQREFFAEWEKFSARGGLSE